MNQLHVGFKRNVKPISGRCLFICDDVSEVPHKFRPKIFDPDRHSFTPLAGIDAAKAQTLAELIYTVYPEGSATLTVRKEKWELAPALLEPSTLANVQGSEGVQGVINDLMFNPVVRKVLYAECGSLSSTKIGSPLRS
jgi:hypothetical protein